MPFGIGRHLRERKAKKAAKKIAGATLSSATANSEYEEADNEASNGLFDSVGESQIDAVPSYDPAPEVNYDQASNEQETADVVNDPNNFAGMQGTSELERLYDMLKSSEKTGRHRHNSESFESLCSSLNILNGALSMQNLGAKEASDDVKTVELVAGLYNNVIGRCDDYLKKKARSKNGQNRQALVATVKELALRDSEGLRTIVSQVGGASREDRQAMRWDTLIKDARRVKLNVNYSKIDKTKAKDGAASEVYQLDANCAEFTTGKKVGGPMFFKPDNKIKASESPAYWLLMRYKQLHPEEQFTDEDIAISKICHLDSQMGQLSMPDRSKAPINFADETTFNALFDQTYALSTSLISPAGLNRVKDVDIMGRNVASSRMANLLGVGNLLAKSEFTQVTGEDGKKRKGILMEGAKGEQASKVITEHENEHKTMKTTPGFLRDMCNLQALDVICGQIDRHGGNFFIDRDKETGVFKGVMGIDNDGSFGLNTQVTARYDKDRSDREVYSDEGTLTIPHLDKKFADKVLALNDDVVKYTMADILGEKEMDALLTRIHKMQEAINNSYSQNPGQIIESDEEWGDPSVRKSMVMDSEEFNKINAEINAASNEAEDSYLHGLGYKCLDAIQNLDIKRSVKMEAVRRMNAASVPGQTKLAKRTYLDFLK